MGDTQDIDDLKKKIEDSTKARDSRVNAGRSTVQPKEGSSQQGVQAGVELVGAIAVCTGIGYGVDQYFETKPLWLIIFFFLGIITGFYNVYRTVNNMSPTVGFSRLHPDEKDAKKSSESETD